MEGSGSSSFSKSAIGKVGRSVSLTDACDVKCKHGLSVTLEVCKRGDNYGKLFLSCPLWKKSPCGFFKWVDDANNENPSISTVNGNDGSLSVVAEGRTVQLEAKVERLKGKKQQLCCENDRLKNQVMELKVERDILKERERVLCRFLYMTWTLVVVALFVIGWKSYV